MKELYLKYKEVILYAVFGGLTTLVNIVVYWLFAHVIDMALTPSTIFAWFFAVLFAYLTNGKWVFNSEASTFKQKLKEMASFYSCRILTGAVDWLIMFFFVNKLNFNDLIIKVVANIIVIILNFIASKFIIFKKEGNKNE